MKNKLTLKTTGLAIAALLSALAGCAGPRATQSPLPVREGREAVITGTVAETMTSGGYTYVCLESDGKRTWAALPATSLNPGQKISIYNGAVMQQFNSKALNRTFDAIIFSGGIVQGPRNAGTQPSQGKQTAPDADLGNPVLAGKVIETMNSGPYTYLLLEKDGRSTWAAIPGAVVTVGQELELIPGIDMVDFKSQKLNRTFRYIHFSGGVKTNAAKPQPSS
ncbi:MAG: hypothetical protein FPO08_16085 [Geobacter sp.]|nr:MAG: hypothetical protein FPO08_16085 [Geobacter sp.]